MQYYQILGSQGLLQQQHLDQIEMLAGSGDVPSRVANWWALLSRRYAAALMESRGRRQGNRVNMYLTGVSCFDSMAPLIRHGDHDGYGG